MQTKPFKILNKEIEVVSQGSRSWKLSTPIFKKSQSLMLKTGLKIIFVLNFLENPSSWTMKMLMFVKFSTQNFWRKIVFLEVEVLKSPQPSNPLAWSVAILQEWIFQIKSQIRKWSLPRRSWCLNVGEIGLSRASISSLLIFSCMFQFELFVSINTA